MSILHNGFIVAIFAQGILGASLLADKILLAQPGTRNLISYVFWMGMLSVLGVLLMPFGFHLPPPRLMALGVGAGIVHLGAILSYYAALHRGEASDTLAIMGGFSPVFTVLIALALLARPLGHHHFEGFLLLVGGGFVMFSSERLALRKVLPFMVLAAAAFGTVNVLEKVVFDATNFVTGYVLFAAGTFLGAACLLARGSWRRQIFTHSGQAPPRSRFWYFLNRVAAGIGSFLVFYAISLENPAIVDGIAGVRYAVIFLGAYALTRFKPEWLEEDFTGRVLWEKCIATLLVAAGLVLLGGEDAGVN